MSKMSEHKVISCLLPQHQALEILNKLAQTKGIIMANKSSARGSTYLNSQVWIEMEMLEVIVENAKADEIYEYLFHETEINTPHGGLIYQHSLARASEYKLPVF